MFRPYRKDYIPEEVIPLHAETVQEERNPFQSWRKSFLVVLSVGALVGLSFAFAYLNQNLDRSLGISTIYKYTITTDESSNQSLDRSLGKLTGNEYATRGAKSSSEPDRPIISTFYNFLSESGKIWPTPSNMQNDPLTQQWKKAWIDAGWEPRVLTMEDAVKHPDFKHYSSAISQIRNANKGSYDYMGFMRYLAMAATGDGGFMSDSDTFPLGGMTPRLGFDLPNFGAFTSYQGHVPALLSGRASEWNRVAKAVLDEAVEHADENFYNEIRAMRDLHLKDEASYIQDFRMSDYPYRRKDTIDCELAMVKMATHLSLPASRRALKSGIITSEGMSSRGNIASTMMDQIKNQCIDDAP